MALSILNLRESNIINITVGIMIVLSLILIIYFLYSKTLHKNHKFIVFISLLSSIGAIALVATLLLSLLYHKQEITQTNINNYLSLFEDYDITVNMFMEHPEMKYYYNELFGHFDLNEKTSFKRNYVLEAQLSFIIFSKLNTFVEYINSSKLIPEKTSEIVKNRITKIFSLHFKSPIFRNHYYYYKKLLATPSLITYVKENFGI